MPAFRRFPPSLSVFFPALGPLWHPAARRSPKCPPKLAKQGTKGLQDPQDSSSTAGQAPLGHQMVPASQAAATETAGVVAEAKAVVLALQEQMEQQQAQVQGLQELHTTQHMVLATSSSSSSLVGSSRARQVCCSRCCHTHASCTHSTARHMHTDTSSSSSSRHDRRSSHRCRRQR